MPGTITFRPIEANLTHNTDLIGKMNPYCAFIVGDSVYRGQVCKKGGKHPHWGDAVTIPYSNSKEVIVEVMDKDRFSRDDNIGSFMLNLNTIQQNGSSRWYPLTHKNKPAGEILLETVFSEDSGFGNFGQSNIQQTGYTGISQPAVVEQEIIREQIPVEREYREEPHLHHDRHIFTEQQQIVEPRTFLKEVDVVETRNVQQNIEVLEPHKVIKDVQYTQAVPVTKQIEVNEPQVVQKEVEVIEPRLVTKTIQVVENVPVMKRVEVIENVKRMQEVQTFEPQTFHKQVEVTDYVPVQKTVTVSEPVHLKKSVEFVEPVITTKTITKELREPVIVDESITTTIGPASITHESATYIERLGQFQLSEEERLIRTNEYRRLQGTGLSDYEINRQFESRGWGLGPHTSGHHHHHTSTHHTNPFSHLSKEQRYQRDMEYERLRGSGLDEKSIERELELMGLGSHSTIGSQGSYGASQGNYGTSQGAYGHTVPTKKHF